MWEDQDRATEMSERDNRASRPDRRRPKIKSTAPHKRPFVDESRHLRSTRCASQSSGGHWPDATEAATVRCRKSAPIGPCPSGAYVGLDPVIQWLARVEGIYNELLYGGTVMQASARQPAMGAYRFLS